MTATPCNFFTTGKRADSYKLKICSDAVVKKAMHAFRSRGKYDIARHAVSKSIIFG
jgi:hypothetical protein